MLTKCRFSPQFFVKVSNIEFHENLSSGSRAGQTQTDMTKLIVTFRNMQGECARLRENVP